MNTLSIPARAAILRALVEGNSLRATARMQGVSKDTVMKLVVDFGEFCEIYQDHRLVHLPCRRVEADEIWGFVGAKQKDIAGRLVSRVQLSTDGLGWYLSAVENAFG